MMAKIAAYHHSTSSIDLKSNLRLRGVRRITIAEETTVKESRAPLYPCLPCPLAELFLIASVCKAAHINNIELGKNGRWRHNVWCYPGASSVSSDSRKGLELHPTVKPTAMLIDAILDLSHRGDIVLDPFLGSGSTLIAAHGIGRRCFGIEPDPQYVDVVIRWCQTVWSLSAVLKSTGETFEALEVRRKNEDQAMK